MFYKITSTEKRKGIKILQKRKILHDAKPKLLEEVQRKTFTPKKCKRNVKGFR